MERNLALSLVIGATVGSTMRTAIGSTISEVGRLGSAVRDAEKGKADALKETAKVERTQQQLQAYRALGREVLTAGRAHRDAQEKVKALAREIGASAAPTKAQEQALEAARKAVTRSAAAEEAKKQRLAALRGELKAAGVDTTKLADAERKLAADLASAKAKADETTRSIGRLGDAMDRVAKQREIGAELVKTIGTVGAAYMALRQPVKEAGDFEHHLRAFGNTANMTAADLEGVRKQIRAMSSDVLQSNDALLSGVEVLVGKGGGFLAFRAATLTARYGMTFLRGGLGAVVRESLSVGRATGAATASVGRLGATTAATGGRLGSAIASLRRYTAAANSAAGASSRLANAQGGIGGLGNLGGVGRLGKALRFGGKALGGVGLALNAGFAAKDLFDPSLSREEKGASVGNLAGGLAGAAAGAAIGSFVPVVGTAIGAIIGGALGAFGGEKLGAIVGRNGVGQTVGGAMAATAAAMPALAATGTPPPQAPPGIERAGPERSIPPPVAGNYTTNIYIQAQPGQDAKAIGEEVRRQLDTHFRQIGERQRGALYD